VLPEALAPLNTLAMNLRWSWHAPTRELFRSLDPELWEESRQDPTALLGLIGVERLEELAGDPDVVARVREADDDLRAYLTDPRWYQESFDVDEKPDAIAYFSAEFGITAVLPQYSGGLGILAGDHLKSASDLGVPIVGVGLLYGAGYFKQSLTRDGWQAETYPVLDPDNLPLSLLREDDGTPARVMLTLPGARVLAAQVWLARVGRIPLLLLDSNVPENDEAARHVTDRLYGGSAEHRLQQELLLGMGGIKAIRLHSRLSGAATPQVYHCNEGHAGFLGIERARELVAHEGLTFAQALESVKAGTVFTTHTPVPAGHDKFSYDLAGKTIGTYLPDNIRALAGQDLLNTTVLALNLSRGHNGVSELHGEVSREMFPGFNIGHVTNGVHHLSWTGDEFKSLFDEYLPTWREQPQVLAEAHSIPDDAIKQAKRHAKKRLISYINSVSGAGFTDELLTICFARRAAAYKRATLIFSDLEYLFNLSFDRVQFIFAGKAHPQDNAGKGLIKEIVNLAKQYENKIRLVFVSNYNIWLAGLMTQGTDVWLNTPRRPREASGTSGMKVCFNGGINMSVLDGWWREGCRNRLNGWAIGDDEDQSDEAAAADLYQDLDDMVTTYYANPKQWLNIMKNSIADLTPVFNTHRMVLEYVHKYYV